MTPEIQVRNRWFAIVAIRIVTAFGAVFGVVLLARATDTSLRLLAIAIVLSALYAMAILPRALAQKWRSR